MKKLLLVGLMMLSSFMTFAQISGKVVDVDSKQPLPGATILVKGTKTGVVTDFDGNFLSQNQPNPMVNNTSFTFGIVEDAEVTIEVHNVAGQLIKTLISGNYEAGEYTVKWNGADNSGRPVKQGVYYYTLKAGNFVDSKKLIIVNFFMPFY